MPADALADNSTLIARLMGPIWGQRDPGGPHVGPMNRAGVRDHQHVQCAAGAKLDISFCDNQCFQMPFR